MRLPPPPTAVQVLVSVPKQLQAVFNARTQSVFKKVLNVLIMIIAVQKLV